MRYVLYARKSSESEDRQVQSIDDQLRVLRELAAVRGLRVVQEVTESKSAKAPGGRPGFDQALRLIEKGQADAILCWSVNRLTRNPIDAGRLSWMLQNGVLQAIQTPDKQYLPTDNVLILSVETGTANQYILDLHKSVRRGTETKLQKGWFPHRAPEGYRNNLYDHTIEADGDRFVLLQRAWRLLLAGTHTPARAIAVLNDEWGYRTRPARGSNVSNDDTGGKTLSRSAGYRLFSSVFYAGYFRHGGQVYRGSHPPMITLSEFERVQRLLHDGQARRAHYNKHAFPYKGLIRCGACGHAVTAELQKGRHGRGNWVYYHCNNLCKDPGRACGKRSIREDRLEEKIDACLARITITEEFKRVVTDALERWVRDEFLGQETEYRQQLSALTGAEKMLNELLEMRLRRVIDDALFQAKQQELQARVGGLRLEVGRTQERLDRTRRTVEDALVFRQRAREQFLVGDAQKRREIARALAVRYVYDSRSGEVFIELNPLLAYMAATSPAASAAMETTPVDGADSHERHAGFPLIEPLETGSRSAKGAAPCETVPPGWPDGTDIEPLRACFRAVWRGDAPFPSAMA
jgi:DNA invertase Pin-like site-specific DNA recombinase